MNMETIIEPFRPDDWPAVRTIYQQGIDTGQATFETTAPGWEAWDAAHLPTCRLVARRAGQVVGWAALAPISRRKVYEGVTELSLYIAAEARGQGVGRALLESLIDESERAGIWTLQASIFAVNSASLALHLSCGFREVGRRERIARRDSIWHDTVILERRSRVVGV